ncbi:MAG TPA: HEAT repeat domain-containing protein [Candidatus Omnitrophota bacterium]|nr:HEAT repeat domain-containing protein [Candidatus Omnitrophota bacterium]
MLIAVTMAVLLSGIVLLTHEEETPETLITAIKTGAPSKRWQKAFELSNELNREGGLLRSAGIMNEVIHILNDKEHYDAQTRAYMAMALSRFRAPEAESALRKALSEVDDSEDPKLTLFLIWGVGSFERPDSAHEISRFLESQHDDLRKAAAYVLGVLKNKEVIPTLERALEDSVIDVRWNAALSLARLGSSSGREILLQMVDRKHLNQVGAQRAVPLLNEAETERVMVNAAKALGLIQDPEIRKTLEQLSKTDSNLKVRQAAMAAIQR